MNKSYFLRPNMSANWYKLIMHAEFGNHCLMGCRFRIWNWKRKYIFSFGNQLYRRRCLPVCQSVCLCATTIFAMFLSSDLHETYTKYSSCGMWVFKSKVQVTQIEVSTFLSVRPVSHCLFLWLCAYLTDCLYIGHRYKSWGEHVSGAIYRPKCQGHTCRSYLGFLSLRATGRTFSTNEMRSCREKEQPTIFGVCID